MLARMGPKPRTGEATRQRPPRSRRLCTSALLLWVVVGARPLDAAALDAPRLLAYRVAWNGIPAAHATVEVTRGEEAGSPAYTIDARAFTNRFVDLFWRFRGDARTTLLAEPVVPLSFHYERRVNRAPTRTWIEFAPSAERARSGYVKPKRHREEVIDARGLTDPITAGFHALTADAGVGDVLTYRVFTGETHYRVRLAIRAEEVVHVPAGRFEALRVEPEVIKIKDGERPDDHMRRATIWVTREPVRTLLRIRSEVFIGAVTLELVDVDRPT
jgi:hypothetical protein